MESPAFTPPPARTLAQLDVWLAQHQEPALEPEIPIVDTHQHVWDRPPQRYGFDALIAEANCGHAIKATVFVECTAMYRIDGPEALRPVGETEWANGIAAWSASGLYGDIRLNAGIVSRADLLLGAAVRETLEGHVRVGGDRFRGIRYQTQSDPYLGSQARRAPAPGLLGDATFREGFAELAPLGLSFDSWLYFNQLGELAALADAFPDTAIIVNHCGGPLGAGHYASRREEMFAVWSAGLRGLAQRPNVNLKVGGLGMAVIGLGFESQPLPPSSEALAAAWRPYVETCIGAFGPDRCMVESNFPVDKQSYGYRELWNAMKRLTVGYTPQERAALFHGTAERVYRLG